MSSSSTRICVGRRKKEDTRQVLSPKNSVFLYISPRGVFFCFVLVGCVLFCFFSWDVSGINSLIL